MAMNKAQIAEMTRHQRDKARQLLAFIDDLLEEQDAAAIAERAEACAPEECARAAAGWLHSLALANLNWATEQQEQAQRKVRAASVSRWMTSWGQLRG
jgi:hypothetical protein